MVSELAKKRLSASIGKWVKVFLIENNFCYEGKLTGLDNEMIEIINSRNNKFKLIRFSEIKDIEVEQ